MPTTFHRVTLGRARADRTRTRRRTLGVVLAPLVAMAMIATAIGATPAVEAAPFANADGTQRWNACYLDIAKQVGTRFECSKVRVPVDYDDPSLGRIPISLVRIPASDPDIDRGSLFLNPGGPGGSGIDFALGFGPFASFVIGPVANQYDIVGFDPRGIGRSNPLRCFKNEYEAASSFPPIPFPTVEADIEIFDDRASFLDVKCKRWGHRLLNHMSTANVARDLDVLRGAVGDEQLNFLGLSYGTQLGQTYANLFPDNVGAMVIDGVLDPIAWANLDAEVPFSTALRSDQGAQATLDEFARQCDAAAPGNCALAPGAAERVDALLDQLREDPILIRDPFTGETFPYLYQYLVGDLLGGLYSPGGYAFLAEYVAFIESQATQPDPRALGRARADLYVDAGFTNERGFPKYQNFAEGFPGVACEDSSNPTDLDTWFAAGQQAAADYGTFGELWTWASPCAKWAHVDEDAYTGPYATDTATPMLVIGNLYDPATRYEGAVTANALLGNSVLLTVDEPGHTSFGLSGCAGFLTGEYLADPIGFAANVVDPFCPSDGNWFDKLAGPPGGSGDGLDGGFRSSVMQQVAYRP